MSIDLAMPGCAVWRIIEKDLHGNVVRDRTIHNLVTNAGRDQVILNTFMLAGSGGFVALGVGASTTPASVSDTRLTHELIGNATRKTLTNTSGAALSPSDIVTYPSGIAITLNGTSTVTFYKSITCQAVYNSGDANNGNQFGEFGLFTTVTNPATPTSTSGGMYNHLIDPSPTQKSSGNSITAQVTLYF